MSLNESTIVIESVKAAVDVYTPLAGKVIAINSEVEKDPTQISQSAETSWLFELSVAEEPKRLLSQEEYRKLLELT